MATHTSVVVVGTSQVGKSTLIGKYCPEGVQVAEAMQYGETVSDILTFTEECVDMKTDVEHLKKYDVVVIVYDYFDPYSFKVAKEIKNKIPNALFVLNKVDKFVAQLGNIYINIKAYIKLGEDTESILYSARHSYNTNGLLFDICNWEPDT